MPAKRKLLLVYDYFAPAYKAGGPIQSLVNLVQALNEKYDISVLTGCYEFGETEPMQSIKVNEWNNWNGQCSVYYWKPSFPGIGKIRQVLHALNPDVVFINGIYSVFFNLMPLVLLRNRARIILSARGMLHAGALSQKSFKKKIFLSLLKKLNLLDGVNFHATDEQESLFIKKQFGPSSSVFIAGNYPRSVGYAKPGFKKEGILHLLSVALISPMKNHLLVLQALRSVNGKVQYTIAGPVKDDNYWKECNDVIRSLSPDIQVEYLGPVEPLKTNTLIESADIIVLPSKSENFGHAILEALQAGRPVITTDQTPWLDLQKSKAGFTLSLEGLTQRLTECIQYYVNLNDQEMVNASKQARLYAEQHIHLPELTERYDQMFGLPVGI